MANTTTRKALREALKMAYLEKLCAALSDEEILRTGSNEIAFPVTDSEGNEDFIVLTVKIPTGSRDDNLPYDGYAEAESYAMHRKEMQEKAEKAAAAKAAKIAKDKAERAAKAKAKAERAAAKA